MASNLTATSNSASQTTTQSPQAATGSGNGTAQSSSVQTGTADSLLRSSNGVPLAATPLSTVNLNPSTTESVTSFPHALPKHHVNDVLLGFSVLLIVIAIFLFWTSGRSVKTTT